jgi:hypothetical protein
MPVFLCLLIGQPNEVLGQETIETDNTSAALIRADQIIRHRPRIAAVEIWRGGHLALRFTRNEMARGHASPDQQET